MITENAAIPKTKKRKRTVNTSKELYEIYLSTLENDYNFRSNTINPTLGENYIERKWSELLEKLNSVGSGPHLTSEEWKKRFCDWKYSTRSKYRKSSEHRKRTGSGPHSGLSLTDIEERALSLWGKAVVTGANKVTEYDGIACNIQNEEMELLELEVEPFTTRDIILIDDCGEILNNNELENLLTVPQKLTENVEKLLPTPNKTSRIRIKPLSILTEKLIDNNNESNASNAELISVLKTFSQGYINLQKEKIEFEKTKLRFKVEKLKLLYPTFTFDV